MWLMPRTLTGFGARFKNFKILRNFGDLILESNFVSKNVISQFAGTRYELATFLKVRPDGKVRFVYKWDCVFFLIVFSAERVQLLMNNQL